jgi:hypothetical protein
MSFALVSRATGRAGRVASGEHVFYPVFPPDKNADEVIDWLRKITQ